MANRRQFIQAGAAAAALPLAAKAVAAPSLVKPDRLVVDARFADAVPFAAAVEQRGGRVEVVHGDVTRFWTDSLEPLWKAGPAAIAGLTSPEAAHVIQLLAARRRAQMVYRAEHIRHADGRLEHDIALPPALLGPAKALASAGDAWPATAAGLVYDCPAGAAAEACLRLSVPPARVGSVKAEHLISWVIAPLRAA